MLGPFNFFHRNTGLLDGLTYARAYHEYEREFRAIICTLDARATKNGDLRPTDVTYGSEKKVWWRCTFGHSWPSIIYNRTRETGSECSICYKKGIRKPAEGQTKLI